MMRIILISFVIGVLSCSGNNICKETQFYCNKSDKCIPSTWRCDGDIDCEIGRNVGEDELDCNNKTCKGNEFDCGDGICIPSKWRCDGAEDCPKGNDEQCKTPTCYNNEFTCDNGKCINNKWKCDGQNDCEDNSDEKTSNCPISTCGTDNFRCNDSECIDMLWRCDGDFDCTDHSDEMNCPANFTNCADTEWACKTGDRCIHKSWQCDGVEDCLDGSDEENCQLTCRPDQFQCANGNCIYHTRRCDKEIDCTDGSDEGNCSVRESLTTHKMPNKTTSLYNYAIDGKPTSTLFNAATTTTTPPLPQRSDISCNADSIDTFVPISMLPSGAPLTWRDPTCSVTSNGTHMISSIGLSQCGTTVTITKDNVEFENELKAQSTNSTANSLIDFGEDAYVIPVKCIYPRTETPMTSYVPLQQHVRFYEKRYGHFDVDIMQYDSDKFSSAIQNLGTPRKVALNSEIYVEVKLNDQFNNGLGIHIDKCIATPTSSPSDSTLYTLLTDGCPASQHVHLYNSPANKVRFGVRAFQFTSQTGAMVYIHCQTSMCQAGTPYCTSNCVTAGRRKRDVAPDQKSHLVSAGPFVLVADEQGTPIRMSTIVASVSAFVAVVACVVAIVGWTRKTRTTSTKEQGLL